MVVDLERNRNFRIAVKIQNSEFRIQSSSLIIIKRLKQAIIGFENVL